ncbi:MAG TPA: hypothetical protein VL200_01915 [Lacunisphaera sp.]|jgi:REP element-mobilizing transposase RayT|nr:hypothetical protein [Lacunisphaera sp.]
MSQPESAANPQRRRPAHLPIKQASNRAVIVFLTVCTKHRRSLLANATMHQLLRHAWSRADHWTVGRYVILPNHLHLFCAPASPLENSLTAWVRYWKGLAAKLAVTGAGSLWEKNFWDTQLRQSESYAARWEYVRLNPVRHGLVTDPGAWPFQGELDHLPWHD